MNKGSNKHYLTHTHTHTQAYCGRYVNQHMLDHQDTAGHKVVLSLADISVWCFECDSYLDNEVLHAAKNSVHLNKFGCNMGGSV